MMPLSTYRWLLGARGAIAMAFGTLALAFPMSTLRAMLLLLAAWAFVDATFAVTAAIARRTPAALGLIRAALSLACGIVLFGNPDLSAAILVTVVGAWALAIGVIEVIAGIRLYRYEHEAPWLAMTGLASIVFGSALLARPLAGEIALAWIVGVYALASGVALVMFAVALRHAARWPGVEELAIGA